MRKIAFLLSFMMVFGFLTQNMGVEAIYKPDESVNVQSKAVYLYNLDTESVVFEQEPQLPMQPASTAKMMTCLLALENTDDLDAEFTYPSYIFDMLANAGNVSQADVRRGEVMTMRKALDCLMLQSDCYSALAIADLIGGGDIPTFIDMMNQKAKDLGAENTVFTNSHGLYDENMHTTAYDLFLIAKYAVKVDGFMDICNKTVSDLSPTNIPAHETGYRVFTTIDTMKRSSPYYYEPIQGIKTGTLDEVGRNYVSMASKNGYTYILVLLGAPYKDASGVILEDNPVFTDAKNIYEWAFNTFESKVLLEKGKTANGVTVRLAKDKDKVNLVAAENFSALVPSVYEVNPAEGEGIVTIPDIPATIDAPVARGQKVGTVKVMLAGMVLGTVDLLAEEDIPRSQTMYILDLVKGWFSGVWVKLLIGVVVLVLGAYITLMVLRNRYRKRRRHARGRRK